MPLPMIHSHQEFDAGPDDLIEVSLDHPANVQLLDPSNYLAYREGRPYRYQGGYAAASPVLLRPPRPGRWYVVVDLGGGRLPRRPQAVRRRGAASLWVRRLALR